MSSIGIFRRYELDISHHSRTSAISDDAHEHVLAVLVHPPEFVGSAQHGGQGGDHEIAR